MLGINEIGYTASSFYTSYRKLVDTVIESQPDAVTGAGNYSRHEIPLGFK